MSNTVEKPKAFATEDEGVGGTDVRNLTAIKERSQSGMDLPSIEYPETASKTKDLQVSKPLPRQPRIPRVAHLPARKALPPARKREDEISHSTSNQQLQLFNPASIQIVRKGVE